MSINDDQIRALRDTVDPNTPEGRITHLLCVVALGDHERLKTERVVMLAREQCEARMVEFLRIPIGNNPPLPKSIAQLAQDALNVQNACNLSGVVISFGNVMRDLRHHLEKFPGFSTYHLNLHPVCQVWSDKIAALAGTQQRSPSDAFEIVHRLARGELVQSGPDLYEKP